MGFPRQEYCNRLPFPSPGDLPDPGIKPASPKSKADCLLSKPPGKGKEGSKNEKSKEKKSRTGEDSG